MTAPTDQYLLLRALVDELVRCGVRDAVTSPGSRSAPIVLSLVRDGRLRCHSQIDERTAGFFALGIAKASGRPAVLACTSGTAAAQYLPAVVEAHEAGVPLVVLTADRPPELREVGAGQAIDQIGLYGRNAKWFFELGSHEATPERLRWVRSLACRLVWTAEAHRAGPVHLNVPVREPLVLDEELPEDPLPGRADGAPWLARQGARQMVSWHGKSEPRPIVVAGRTERCLPPNLAKVPVLADPLSGARRGPFAIAHYDALLRHKPFATGHAPDVVVRVGDLPTSKPLRQWLASLDIPQIAFRSDAVWSDPTGALSEIIDAEPETLAFESEKGWVAAWRDADAAASRAIDETLGDALSEPRVARELVAALPADHTLVVASSMPVRDVETFAPVRDHPPRVLANRGANGIDGTIATALGVAATGMPTTVLLGDVALAHDAGSLLSMRRGGPDFTIVLLNNGGGGIFDFLPVSTQTDAYEEHVATAPQLDVPALCAAAGIEYVLAQSLADVRAALGRRVLVEVVTDRAENVALHRRVWDAVAAAL